jgi:hypothetical protein
MGVFLILFLPLVSTRRRKKSESEDPIDRYDSFDCVHRVVALACPSLHEPTTRVRFSAGASIGSAKVTHVSDDLR